MVKIGRPLGGIPINGLEYVLDNDGNEMSFSDEATALEFMHGQGYTDEDIENDGIVFPDVSEAETVALITKDNIEINQEIFIEDDYINAYIAAWLKLSEGATDGYYADGEKDTV